MCLLLSSSNDYIPTPNTSRHMIKLLIVNNVKFETHNLVQNSKMWFIYLYNQVDAEKKKENLVRFVLRTLKEAGFCIDLYYYRLPKNCGKFVNGVDGAISQIFTTNLCCNGCSKLCYSKKNGCCGCGGNQAHTSVLVLYIQIRSC